MSVLGVLGGTFAYCLVAALVPVMSAEAYVAAAGALTSGVGLWGLAAAAAVGQVTGKTPYYLLGSATLRLRWFAAKTESPRWQAAFERWQARINGRPIVAAGALLLSAFASIPPFAILSVLAGQLRVPLPMFLLTGLVGRLARFALILGAVDWVFGP